MSMRIFRDAASRASARLEECAWIVLHSRGAAKSDRKEVGNHMVGGYAATVKREGIECSVVSATRRSEERVSKRGVSEWKQEKIEENWIRIGPRYSRSRLPLSRMPRDASRGLCMPSPETSVNVNRWYTLLLPSLTSNRPLLHKEHFGPHLRNHFTAIYTHITNWKNDMWSRVNFLSHR